MEQKFTISLYRDEKFVTRRIGMERKDARTFLEGLANEKWLPGNYEARLLSQGRVLKKTRWIVR